jgi:O-antigen ligase
MVLHFVFKRLRIGHLQLRGIECRARRHVGHSTDTRLAIWADTLRLVKAYPLFGAGAGAYESALYRYKTADPLNTSITRTTTISNCWQNWARLAS